MQKTDQGRSARPTFTQGAFTHDTFTQDTFTQDTLLGGRIRLCQPQKGMRASIDAFFLAAAVPAKPGDRLVEAGIGSGAASLAVLARVARTHVTGIEINPESVALAAHNAGLNGWGGRAQLIEADITTTIPEQLLADGGHPPFDHALANPPFRQTGQGRAPADQGRQIALAMPAGALEKWVQRLAGLVRGGGTVTFIHQASALPGLLAAMDRHLGGLLVLPIAPRAGVPAKRVVVRGTKGSRAPLQLLPAWALHQGNGDYTCQTEAVLRDGAPVDLE